MKKMILRTLGLLTLVALASSVTPVQAVDPICPFCIIGYKCCIQGQNARCIPETAPCN